MTSFKVIGIDNVIGGLDSIIRNLEDMTSTMTEVNTALEDYHRRNWGRGVKDLPQTKIRHPDSDLKLDETGALKASMVDSSAAGAIRLVTPHSATYGTSLWYANFAQKGTPTEKRKPVLKVNTSVRKMVREIVYNSLWRGAEHLRGDSTDG